MSWIPWKIINPSKRNADKHIGHQHHLCDLVRRGEVSLEQFKEFVRDPNYICKKCARTAKTSINLCHPVPL
jgi:hypothetical protein